MALRKTKNGDKLLPSSSNQALFDHIILPQYLPTTTTSPSSSPNPNTDLIQSSQWMGVERDQNGEMTNPPYQYPKNTIQTPNGPIPYNHPSLSGYSDFVTELFLNEESMSVLFNNHPNAKAFPLETFEGHIPITPLTQQKLAYLGIPICLYYNYMKLHWILGLVWPRMPHIEQIDGYPHPGPTPDQLAAIEYGCEMRARGGDLVEEQLKQLELGGVIEIGENGNGHNGQNCQNPPQHSLCTLPLVGGSIHRRVQRATQVEGSDDEQLGGDGQEQQQDGVKTEGDVNSINTNLDHNTTTTASIATTGTKVQKPILPRRSNLSNNNNKAASITANNHNTNGVNTITSHPNVSNSTRSIQSQHQHTHPTMMVQSMMPHQQYHSSQHQSQFHHASQ